jgi:hypothetical protein
LEEFFTKMKKYNKSLGTASTRGSWRSAPDKVMWRLNVKDETRKLQSYLNIHIGTINMLLSEHGLERMPMVAEKSQNNQMQLHERVESIHGLLEDVVEIVRSQASTILSSNSMLGSIVQTIIGELVGSLKLLWETVSKSL